MHEYFAYYPASSGSVRGAAETTRSKGDAVHALIGQVEQEHQRAVQAVEGAMRYTVMSSPDDAKAAAEDVGRKTAWASCQLEEFADAIDLFDHTSEDPPSVSKLNTTYASQAAGQFGVPDVHYPAGATPADKTSADSTHATAVANARTALLSDLRAKYVRLETNLDDAASRIAGNLQRQPTAAEIVAAWKAGNLPISAMLLWPSLDLQVYDIPSGLPADLAVMTDRELADYLLAHPDTDPNIMLNLDTIRPGVVSIMGAELAQQIRDAKVDWDTDPDRLRALNDLLSTWQDSSLAVTAAMYQALGAKDALLLLSQLGNNFQGEHDGGPARDLAATFRDGLGLADLMWTDQQRGQYGTDLGSAVTDNARSYPPVAGMDYALSYLMQDQSYSAALLNPLGDALVDMDRGPRSWDTFTGSNLNADPDLMSSYFSALAHNDEAGKHFFTQEGRLHWYVSERGDADPFYFDHLGDSLQAAATENVDADSAAIAQLLVHDIGSGDAVKKTFSETDLMNPELRDDVAEIMKTFIGDAHNAMVPGANTTGPGLDGDWDPVTPGVQGFGARFDQRELAYVLGDLGKDEDAHHILTAAENTYSAAAYNHYMSDPDLTSAQRADQAQRVANPSGSILGALDFGAASQEHQTTADNDKAHNDAVDGGFKIADALVGLVPVDKVPLAGDLVDGLMDGLKDSMQQDTSGLGNYNAGTVYDGGQTSAEALAQAAFYRNTPDDLLPPELQGHPPVGQWTEAQEGAYVDWLQSTGATSAGSNNTADTAGNAYSDGYQDAQTMIDG